MIRYIILCLILIACAAQPGVEILAPRGVEIPAPREVDAIAYCNPRVIGRATPPYWTPEHLYVWLHDRMSLPQYDRALIHMPQGWVNTMAGGAWHGMSEEYQEVYAKVFGRILAERPGYEITLYTGGQFYTAFSIVGRPREDGNGHQPFIAEPDWINASDPHDVRGIRDLTLQPWSDIGVSGVVFDSGSKFPMEVVRWLMLLEDQVDTVGLEAIPWIGSTAYGRVDWEACRMGVEYHANQRYRNGRPFLEVVPTECVGRAFVWLVHDLDPTPEEVADMMRRGWTPVVLWSNDDLYESALAMYEKLP